MYHENVNINLTEENVIQINGGIRVKVDSSGKTSFMSLYTSFSWNPATYNCENWNYLARIVNNSAVSSLIKRKETFKREISVFYLHFINYYRIIDSC